MIDDSQEWVRKGVFEKILRVSARELLDRVLHHAVTVNIRGNSYRLKDKLKSGIVQAATEALS